MRFSAAVPLVLASVAAAQPARFEYSEPHMGTTVRVVLYAEDKESADRAAKAAFARVAALNKVMSDYDPESELSRLCRKNADAPAGPVAVGDELFTVLAKAKGVSERSDGAFDVTIGPVVRLWRQARKDRRLPDEAERKAALARVGHKHLVLDAKTKTVELRVAGMQLDLGGIGKGFAADEALRVIGTHGISSALVAASGDIAVSKAPPGKASWRIDIEGTDDQALLVDAAISTSGDSEQFVEIAGTRYSHVVDPRTGLGLTGRRSVTVIAPRGIDADSLTKMASILDPDRALAIIDAMDGTATRIAVRGEKERRSKRFEKFLAKE